MSSLEIADAKASLEKQLAVLELIEQSRKKGLVIAGNSYYPFGSQSEKTADLEKQKAVTARLSNYFANLQREALHA